MRRKDLGTQVKPCFIALKLVVSVWDEMIGEECLAVIVYLAVLNTRALSDVLSSCRSRLCWQVAVCRAVNAILVVCTKNVQMRMQNLEMELNKPSSRREQERALGGDQLEMARPTCNFIRHTLTFFSRFFSPPECPKGEIPASGRRPELGWTAYTRKGTNLSFGKSSYLYRCMRAVMHFPSFLD